jgi:hypothetical protein
MPCTSTVASLDSGPVGAAFAGEVLENAPHARVVMFEAGPQLTEVPDARLPPQPLTGTARRVSTGTRSRRRGSSCRPGLH